jgi:mitogen-activated protein kinase 7
MQRHSFTAISSTFVVDSEYMFVKELGQGAYGCVIAAKHRRSGEGCAIKKITNINTKVCPSYPTIPFKSDIYCDSRGFWWSDALEKLGAYDAVKWFSWNLLRSPVSWCTSEDIRMWAPFLVDLVSTLIVLPRQITCVYDMDIVFQPNGNFDEVYLYVQFSFHRNLYINLSRSCCSK